MNQIRIINNLNDAKNLVAKSLIYDKIHKQNINWLQQPDQGEVFSINEGTNGNLIADIFKISITYHNIDSSSTYDLGFGDAIDILKVTLNDREIDKSTLTSFVFDNDGDNVLDVYINKDPNNESIDIHWSDVSPEIDPVTVHINKYIGNIPRLSANIKDVICDAPTIKIIAGIFGSTKIESFEYDGVIEYIGDNGFRACKNLKSIELKDGLQYIGNSAFDSSGLTGELTLPNSIKSIGSSSFNCCLGLTQLTLSSNLISIGDGAFNGCSGLTGELTLPNSIKSIGSSSFNRCSGLTQLTLSSNLTSIGDGAFSNCSGLTELTLPDSLTSIGGGAFSNCSGLTELTLPDSLTSIGQFAFAGCRGLKNITINNGDILSSNTFIGCPVENITINNVKIYYNIFNSNNIKSVTLRNTEIIGDSAFNGCTGLTEITLPDNLILIENYAFSGCSGLTELTLPDSLTSIGNVAFAGCKNATIYVPETIETIGDNAFKDVNKVVLKNYTRFDNWQTWGATEIVEE